MRRRILAMALAASSLALVGGASLVAISRAGALATPGWRLTVYYTPVERYFRGPLVHVAACTPSRTADLGWHPGDFLATIRTEGSGQVTVPLKADGDRYLRWNGSCGTAEAAPFDASGRPVQSWTSVAADPQVPFGTSVRVTACGTGIPTAAACERVKATSWVVTDRGPDITGMHLDLYLGTQDGPEFETSANPYWFDACGASVDLGMAIPPLAAGGGRGCRG